MTLKSEVIEATPQKLIWSVFYALYWHCKEIDLLGLVELPYIVFLLLNSIEVGDIYHNC